MAKVTLGGNPVNTNGELPALGSKAPDFRLTTAKLEDVGLDSYAGKKKIISIVPSLDTGTCAQSARTFNEQIANRDDAVVLNVSADLPFASERFCQAEGIDQIITLSMMRSRDFARDYGVLITDGPLAGIATRAVVVLDEDNNVLYTELVSEITEEPDYSLAFAALS